MSSGPFRQWNGRVNARMPVKNFRSTKRYDPDKNTMMARKTGVFCVFIVTILLMVGCSPTKPQLVDIGPGWSRTMVNATVFRTNSIVSHRGYQYVAYYDSLANVVLAKRKLGASKWEVKQTQ